MWMFAWRRSLPSSVDIGGCWWDVVLRVVVVVVVVVALIDFAVEVVGVVAIEGGVVRVSQRVADEWHYR